MRIERLKLTDFRTYTALDLPLKPGVNVFLGANAQGKTNLLEAIYLCCVGRSHRTAHDAQMIRHGMDMGLVDVDYVDRTGGCSVSVKLKAHGAKDIELEGLPITRIGELYGHLCSVLFSPEDLLLVKEGPAQRRRYMDIALSQVRPAYFYRLQQYHQALKHRNALLKDCLAIPSLIETMPMWDERVADSGSAVMQMRMQFVEGLSVQAPTLHDTLCMGQETLTVSYAPNVPTHDDIKANFLNMLKEQFKDDMRKGTTSVGPHRDDLLLQIDGMDARYFASQGQQRTAALSLKLAELFRMQDLQGEWPVLLLDDVFSELDLKRQGQLLELLPQVQILITCTDASLLRASTFTQYNVALGRVEKI